jgi:hypothetical protein
LLVNQALGPALVSLFLVTCIRFSFRLSCSRDLEAALGNGAQVAAKS